ncbi:MAG: FctA domain-containing protein [Eggerthellaceae bacterium]
MVREVPDGATGLYYDGANHVVTIDVADDGNGQLKVTTKVDGQAGNVVSFVNKYRAQDVSFDTATAQLKKILEGRDWLDSDSFTFNLKALTDGAPMPDGAVDGVATATVTKANAENFGFGNITYASEMLQGAPSKTFKYEVSEATGTIGDIDYATNKATITVTVVDNGKGKLTASASTENGTFVNRYTASVNYTANGGIQLAKVLNGRDMVEGQFKVAVTPANAESANVLGLAEGSNEFAMPAGTDSKQVLKQILSDDVVFTQSDAGKTYTYKVAEVNGGEAGYTYDGTVYTVTIKVTISDTGKLTVTTTVTGGESAGTYVCTSDSAQPNPVTLAFTNSYKAEGDVAISGTKTLSGRSLTNGEFSFALKYFAGGDDLLSAKNAANGSINFGTLSYSTESLAQLVKDGKAKKGQDGKWTVDYVAYEKTDGLKESGITPQTESIHFTVTVVDNGNGTLVATANTGNNGLVFKNAYSTGDPIEVGLSGVKILKASEGLTPASIEGKFTFTVTSDDRYAPMPASTSVKNDANGNVDFGSIAFSLDDLNKALGATNTRATDTDNSAASKADDQGSQGAEGQNGAADSDAAGQADSEQGSAVDSGNGAESQGAVMAADDGQGKSSAKTVANDADTKAVVGDADAAKSASDQTQSSEPSTRAGVSRSHIFTYKVTESGSAAGVTNDANVTKTVSFKVTDDGNGKLTVERLGAASDPAFAFTNTYSVQPTDSSVTDQVKVTKQLTGRDMAAGEFAFELLEGNDVVATGTNSADGSVALSPITYTKPGIHGYMLREVGGGTHKAGVEYDGSVFAVTTTVTDNGDGTLSVAHKVDSDANTVGFTNSYTPAATSVTLGASKVLNGKSLDAEEFAFVLTDEGGKQVTATNDANGMVVFPAIQYGEAGTYQYTIAEVKGDESDVTYDESEYAVTVTVEDNGEGSLVATVAYEGGNAPVFTNTYNAPEAPASPGDGPASVVEALVSGSAKTGDYLLVIAGVAAAVAAAAAAVAVVSRRKNGKHAKR